MSKLKKEELNKLRNTLKANFEGEIVVSLGTCGIAAGGDVVFDYFKRELKDRGLDEIVLKKTGCLGMCFCEPNLIIKIEGMPEIMYGDVDEEVAKRIISEHIMRKNVLDNNSIFMPSSDILTVKGGK